MPSHPYKANTQTVRDSRMLLLANARPMAKQYISVSLSPQINICLSKF